MGCEPGSGGSWSDVSPSELESRYIIPCHPMSPRVTPWCQRGLQMVLSSCSTSGSDSSVSDGIPDDFHIPDQPVSPWMPPLLRWEGYRARVEQGDRGSRCPSATLPPGTDGTTQEEATAKTESKKWSAPNQPEPHWHPGEPGATTVCSGPEGTVLQGYLSPVLFHPSSGSDLSSLPPRLGPEDIQFFLVSRMEVAEWERSPEAAPILPFPGQLEQGMALVPSQEQCLELTLEWAFPGHQKDGMAMVPPWESISWRVAQTL